MLMASRCVMPSFLAGFLAFGLAGVWLFEDRFQSMLMFLAGGIVGLKVIVRLWGRYYFSQLARHYCSHMEDSLATWLNKAQEGDEFDLDVLCRSSLRARDETALSEPQEAVTRALAWNSTHRGSAPLVQVPPDCAPRQLPPFAGLLQVALISLLAAGLVVPGTAAHAADADWRIFKERFLRSDGRIVDDGVQGVSHSEGQGVAMLLAVQYGDRATFDLLWRWTRKNLQVREDALLAWRWHPKDGVTDRNNATDGDLFVAWALFRAQRAWPDGEYAAPARAIAREVRTSLVRMTPRGAALLPGREGFEKPEGIIVNPSYWLFPALAEFAAEEPAQEWNEVVKTGIRLLQEARFGRWGLPPDWVLLGDKLALPEGFAPRFAYNAVRIPLYLIWSGCATPELISAYQGYWGYFDGGRFLPSWTDLRDDSVDSYDAFAGIHAIAELVRAFPRVRSAKLAPLTSNEPYYSAVLLLLAQAMLWETAGLPLQ